MCRRDPQPYYILCFENLHKHVGGRELTHVAYIMSRIHSREVKRKKTSVTVDLRLYSTMARQVPTMVKDRQTDQHTCAHEDTNRIDRQTILWTLVIYGTV